ncbi:hypothetical protein AVEN_39900-1 [Araneus ventricosus]|uniref:Uncharacterized protein n=1 Tax=Araneus ventricosus TaxID=182803 RepID=A0A4Y2AUC6_ARAVE|nr:hypothetical protein AVEN_96863-1 [Araneus ventricosus]GBL83654.1 hypothetical protein AVEN_39900-1 [Araneus ventricosus]
MTRATLPLATPLHSLHIWRMRRKDSLQFLAEKYSHIYLTIRSHPLLISISFWNSKAFPSRKRFHVDGSAQQAVATLLSSDDILLQDGDPKYGASL